MPEYVHRDRLHIIIYLFFGSYRLEHWPSSEQNMQFSLNIHERIRETKEEIEIRKSQL